MPFAGEYPTYPIRKCILAKRENLITEIKSALVADGDYDKQRHMKQALSILIGNGEMEKFMDSDKLKGGVE